ncbi:META domain-containing protein [Nordella sp. HKS 07]|uniref:YbaY family lipoprotein n=1 Tax=Nordella sp. HKS 07 TaxID=2712222 RepID=UPI0013E0FA96|nr:YbaY family lipoprotein [Nordella sp. HKS 07]QIG48892.1 META domain-containing protein [Nordella sp. HKS 07]
MSHRRCVNPISRRKLMGLAAMLALLPVSPALAATQSLRGSVSYRERIALPPHAILEVRLLDISLADAPAKTIAVTRVKTRHRMPIPYRLRYDQDRIRRNRSYALQARITVNGKLWFISTTRHSVFTGKPNVTDIQVERVASETSNPSGKWLAESIRRRGVIDSLQTVLDIAADGRVSGSGGCNRISGKADISGERITFSPLASTRMACAPAVMDQESKFLGALNDVRKWRVDNPRGKLFLLDAQGNEVLLLARM